MLTDTAKRTTRLSRLPHPWTRNQDPASTATTAYTGTRPSLQEKQRSRHQEEQGAAVRMDTERLGGRIIMRLAARVELSSRLAVYHGSLRTPGSTALRALTRFHGDRQRNTAYIIASLSHASPDS